MMTEIRPMAAGDATEMAQLWARTWREVARSNGREPRHQDPTSLERSAADFAYILCTDPGASFLATSGGPIVGLATGLVRGDTYLLSHLCVAPEHQDQGLGRQLLGRRSPTARWHPEASSARARTLEPSSATYEPASACHPP